MGGEDSWVDVVLATDGWAVAENFGGIEEDFVFLCDPGFLGFDRLTIEQACKC